MQARIKCAAGMNMQGARQKREYYAESKDIRTLSFSSSTMDGTPC
jgi:hypothetical protein